MATSPGYSPNLATTDPVLPPSERAQVLLNLGVTASASAWTKVAGLQPSIALDFAADRYFGGAAAMDVTTTRSAGTHQYKDSAGTVLSFTANQIRRSDLGLFYDANDTMVLGGVMAQAIRSSAGTLLVETGISEVVEGSFDITTGPDSSNILGGVATIIVGRGGNASLAVNFTASGISGPSNAPGNGRLFDSACQAVALRWDGAGNRSLCNGGGTVVSGTGGIGDRTTVYIGRQSNGNVGTGIIRSIRYFPQALSDSQLQLISYYQPGERKFCIWGDSLAGAAGVASPTATGWFVKLAASFNPDGGYFPGGVGGDTTKGALDRFNNIVPGAQADSDPTRHREWIWLLWTGHNDAGPSDTVAGLKAMTELLGGEMRFLVLLPLHNTGNIMGSGGYQRIVDTRALIRATFPAARIADIPAILATAAPGDANVALGQTPSVHLADGIHLNQAGQDLVSAALKAQILRLGW